MADPVSPLIKQIVDIINQKAGKNELNSKYDFQGFLTNANDLPVTSDDNNYYIIGDIKYVRINGQWVVDDGTIVNTSDNTTDEELIELIKNMQTKDHSNINVLNKLSESAAGKLAYNSNELVDSELLYRPNHLINGDFRVWERGVTIVVDTAGTVKYTADRWRATMPQKTSGSAIVTVNESAAPIGIPCCMNIDQTTLVSADSVYLDQIFEAENVKVLRGKQVTFSVFVKCSVVSPNAMILRIQDGTNSDGYPSTNYTYQDLNFHPTTEWVRYSVTKTIPANANSFVVRIITPASYQGHINLYNAKLEIGTKPTIFIPRLIEEERTLCRRFFMRFDNGSDAKELCLARIFNSTVAFGSLDLPTCLRATPLVNISGPFILSQGSSNLTVTSVSIDGRFTPAKNIHHIMFWISLSGGGIGGYCGQLIGSSTTSKFELDSEMY